MRRFIFITLMLAADATAASARADQVPPERKPPERQIDYSAEIRPILSAKCFRCHGADESSREAKLRLDLRDEAVRERHKRRAIAPRDLAHSELVKRITTTDEEDVMPPLDTKNPLEPREVELLQRWIAQGAPYSPHWAFLKPVRPVPPRVARPWARWARNGIDSFVLGRLEDAGLSPSPPADPYALIRRVSLDLTGLPPLPAEVTAFAADKRPDAYEHLVDRLLAAPAFGERFARVWLDLARYADSAGYGSDPLRPDAWPYRDWVINAFNKTLPSDQFTLQQIAGDLLPRPTRDQLVATAFHRNTMTNTEGGTDDEEWRVAAVKDRANVTSQVWMGLTMGCAQCHSHKFDPITHREYYQFFAFFNQTEDSDKDDDRPRLSLWTPAQEAERARLQAEIGRLEVEYQRVTPAFEAERTSWEADMRHPTTWTPLPPTRTTTVGPTVTVVKLRPTPGLGALRIDKAQTFRLADIQVRVLDKKPAPLGVRFVRIAAPGKKRVLSLAEVQVMGTVSGASVDLALGGKASQSSDDVAAVARRAIDGNTDGNFAAMSSTRTDAQDDPWWELDLGRVQPADELVLWGRTEGKDETMRQWRVSLLDDARRPVWERSVETVTKTSVRWSLNGERVLELRPAAATGLDAILVSGDRHALTVELAAPLAATGVAQTLTVVLTQAGEPGTSGPFAISATAEDGPVRLLPADIQRIVATPAADRSTDDRKRLDDHFRPRARSLMSVTDELKRRKDELAAVKTVAVPVMSELKEAQRRTSHILNKGNFLDPGDTVTPGVPAAFHAWPAGAPVDRRGLAAWLMSADNPLTARVAVNRFWAQLFGMGIVETEEDFGTQGTLPTHRELLDWLAVTFATPRKLGTVARPGLGWDVKALLKLMVTSATYRQSAAVTPALLEADPRNQLFSRASRRRLDAETIRDQALALGGLLSLKIGGPSVFPPQPEGLWRAAFNGQRTWTTSTGDDRYRRGLYTFLRRTVPYPSMATFDAPSRETCSMRRIHTNTPLQAFVTLNDPVFFEAAQALGRRIVREGGATPTDRIRYGLLLALGRPPVDAQVAPLLKLYQDELDHYTGHPEEARKLGAAETGTHMGPLPDGLSPAEAAAWSVVANVLLNLDGLLTRG